MSAPLRVAVVGSGPAGFYTVQQLFRDHAATVRVDMLERLPTPFGLVRHGVAPDHQKIKSVTAVYDKLAGDPRFRFLGNVDYGRDVSRAELTARYHAVVFCTGAQTDRRLGIPGEDLDGSHPATEFVAWYNGHPDFVDCRFRLDCERAVVIGVGNVAVDVARILCRTPDEFERTDIADHALEALRASRIREVFLVGRRGPAQAAFSNPEVKELGALEGACARTVAEEMKLDAASRDAADGDRATARKIDILNGFVDADDPEKARTLHIRFLLSPTEILGENGRVSGVRLVRNELVAGDDGRIGCRPTERSEAVSAGLVFRSVGYRGVPLADVPFDETTGRVPNEVGRVVDPASGATVPGLYVSGWIKRGPSGVIGTNKPDGAETANAILDDFAHGRLAPAVGDSDLESLLRDRGVRVVSYGDWRRIDEAEIARGQRLGRPRSKLVRLSELLQTLDG